MILAGVLVSASCRCGFSQRPVPISRSGEMAPDDEAPPRAAGRTSASHHRRSSSVGALPPVSTLAARHGIALVGLGWPEGLRRDCAKDGHDEPRPWP